MAGVIPTIHRTALCGFVLAFSTVPGANAQTTVSQTMQAGPPSGRQVSVDDALEGALKASSLTRDGKPFHAVEDIGKPNGEYSGTVEIWWQSPRVYKLRINSPKFSETKVVNLDSVNEKDEGDYYPRWLENFVLALLDPVPVEQNFR